MAFYGLSEYVYAHSIGVLRTRFKVIIVYTILVKVLVAFDFTQFPF